MNNPATTSQVTDPKAAISTATISQPAAQGATSTSQVTGPQSTPTSQNINQSKQPENTVPKILVIEPSADTSLDGAHSTDQQNPVTSMASASQPVITQPAENDPFIQPQPVEDTTVFPGEITQQKPVTAVHFSDIHHNSPATVDSNVINANQPQNLTEFTNHVKALTAEEEKEPGIPEQANKATIPRKHYLHHCIINIIVTLLLQEQHD